MFKRLFIVFLLFAVYAYGQDLNSLLQSSGGEITSEIRNKFLAEKKSELLKAVSDSGFSIRASTISYIDNSKLLYEGLYGTFTKSNPHILRNLDSLLIYAENGGNSGFWDDKQNVLLGAAVGRNGLGVGEHKVLLWNDLKPAFKGELEALAEARKEGVTYAEWLEKEYNRIENSAKKRQENNKALLKSIQDTILSWVGKVTVEGINNRENIFGYRNKGLLTNDEFMYARVYATDSLKQIIAKMFNAANYPVKVSVALNDVKDVYSPIKIEHNNQMAVYDYFKDLITWQKTPKAELNWNPVLTQKQIDGMAHPSYKTYQAPWQMVQLLSRSFRKNELEWIRQNYLGYLSHKDKSSTDTTQVYFPKVTGYGPYRKGDLNKYRLIAHPLDGYPKLLRVGGVCGTESSIGQQVSTAFGRPVYKAGQPGHSCTIVFSLNGTNSFVTPGQSASTKENTTSLNFFRDTEFSFGSGKFVNALGLAYGLNISEESWITTRIAYSLWKNMNNEEKENIGVEMMTKALEKNGGYVEALYALLRFCQKSDGDLFVSTFKRIVDAIDARKDSFEKGTNINGQCAEYKDLLTFHFIDQAFVNNSYWPESSTLPLLEWLKPYVLEKEPSVKDNEYKKQNERLVRISNRAKAAIKGVKQRRKVTSIKVIPPELKDGINNIGTEQDESRLVDGDDSKRYRLEYGTHVAKITPFEFMFIFPEVYPVETMQMVHWTGNGTVTLRAKDYDIYWSTDSVNWVGPHTGRFTKSKLQILNFDPDTTIIPMDTVDVVDSNGVVVDFEVTEPETLVVTNPVEMRYVKYVPKSNWKEDPFKGIIAQEFSFYYTPDLAVPLTATKNMNREVVLNSNGITLWGTTTKALRVVNMRGQVVARINPKQLGDRVYYPFRENILGDQLLILAFPKELGIKPMKLTR